MSEGYKVLGKQGRIWQRDETEEWLFELHDFYKDYVSAPRQEYLKLCAMVEEYNTRLYTAYGTGVSYDCCGLGVRVQTTRDNYFERNMCSLSDLERQIDIQYMKFISKWFTLKNIINQMEIKDRKNRDYVRNIIRKTLIEFYNPYRERISYTALAKQLNKNYDLVYRNIERGEVALQLAMISYYDL